MAIARHGQLDKVVWNTWKRFGLTNWDVSAVLRHTVLLEQRGIALEVHMDDTRGAGTPTARKQNSSMTCHGRLGGGEWMYLGTTV